MKDRVQSVLFEKRRFTIPQARKYLKSHGFVDIKVHTTDQYHRFRQFDPVEGKRYVTRPSKDLGVHYIVMY